MMPISDQRLTAYNGTGEKYEDGSEEAYFLDPKKCCGPRPPGKRPIGCMFDLESKENKEIYYKLHFGEAFKIERDDGKEEILSWTPIKTEEALRRSVDLLISLDDLGMLIWKKIFMFDEEYLYVAVSLVKTFIQLNFTGPDVSKEVEEKLELLDNICLEKFPAELRRFVEVDGIAADSGVKHPILLLLAMYYLSALESRREAYPYALIWKFRIFFLRQRALTRRSWTLCRQLKLFADNYLAWLCIPSHAMEGKLAEINGSFLCEIAEMLVYYYDGFLSEKILNEAMKVLGVKIEFTGKLGYRTKFQQTAKPQTMVSISPSWEPNVVKRMHSNAETWIPKSLALEDDTRLDRLRLVDEEEALSYSDVNQSILIGLMLQKHGFQENHQELKRQEEEALINAIIDCPVSWSGRLKALVTRSQLEKTDLRAVDRSLRQIEDLSKAISRRVESTDDIFRQYQFFGSGHPLKNEIKMMLGEVLMAMEHWKEALTIYTELDAFEYVVKCYQMMQLRHKAEELIRQKIAESGKNPRLLVLLGDATTDISFYEEAWILSKERSLESQIRLGYYYYSRKEYPASIVHLKRAVELAPLDYPTWLKLAWACYNTEDYENGFQAYLRSANLEYDNFQVWNNLANCALKLDKKVYALRAYKIAAKCSYDEWKVWSNILNVATDLVSLTDMLESYHRLLDLKKDFCNVVALEQAVSFKEGEFVPTKRLLETLSKLFGRVTSLGVRNPIVWVFYARVLAYYVDCDDCEEEEKARNYERSMNYYEKALSLMRQNPNWRTNIILLENVLKCISEHRIYREKGQDKVSDEVNARLEDSDQTLRKTAKSVFEDIKKIRSELISENKQLEEVYETICAEIAFPFHEPGPEKASTKSTPSS